MAKALYIGASNVAKKGKSGYIGVANVARKIKKMYVGDANGVAREFYTSKLPTGWVLATYNNGGSAMTRVGYTSSTDLPLTYQQAQLYGQSGKTLNVFIHNKRLYRGIYTEGAQGYAATGGLYYYADLTKNTRTNVFSGQEYAGYNTPMWLGQEDSTNNIYLILYKRVNSTSSNAYLGIGIVQNGNATYPSSTFVGTSVTITDMFNYAYLYDRSCITNDKIYVTLSANSLSYFPKSTSGTLTNVLNNSSLSNFHYAYNGNILVIGYTKKVSSSYISYLAYLSGSTLVDTQEISSGSSFNIFYWKNKFYCYFKEDSTSAGFYSSSDGINWEKTTLSLTSTQMNKIINQMDTGHKTDALYADNGMGSNSQTQVLYSNDGVNWTNMIVALASGTWYPFHQLIENPDI